LDETVESSSDAGPVFAEGGGVGVILKDSGFSELATDVVSEREIEPTGEIVGVDDDLTTQVHGSRGADADGGDVVERDAGLGDGFARNLADAANALFRTPFGAGGKVGPAEGSTGVIDDARLDVGSSEVDAKEEGGRETAGHSREDLLKVSNGSYMTESATVAGGDELGSFVASGFFATPTFSVGVARANADVVWQSPSCAVGVPTICLWRIGTTRQSVPGPKGCRKNGHFRERGFEGNGEA
jgi:hypothetical protein